MGLLVFQTGLGRSFQNTSTEKRLLRPPGAPRSVFFIIKETQKFSEIFGFRSKSIFEVLALCLIIKLIPYDLYYSKRELIEVSSCEMISPYAYSNPL